MNIVKRLSPFVLESDHWAPFVLEEETKLRLKAIQTLNKVKWIVQLDVFWTHIMPHVLEDVLQEVDVPIPQDVALDLLQSIAVIKGLKGCKILKKNRFTMAKLPNIIRMDPVEVSTMSVIELHNGNEGLLKQRGWVSELHNGNEGLLKQRGLWLPFQGPICMMWKQNGILSCSIQHISNPSKKAVPSCKLLHELKYWQGFLASNVKQTWQQITANAAWKATMQQHSQRILQGDVQRNVFYMRGRPFLLVDVHELAIRAALWPGGFIVDDEDIVWDPNFLKNYEVTFDKDSIKKATAITDDDVKALHQAITQECYEMQN